MARNRSNPLALAVLICLYERSMHPYEVATTLRQRHKDDSVRLNYGSLYAVAGSLERRGLIAAEGTARAGRLPERTVYRITDAGRLEAHDWLADLGVTKTHARPHVSNDNPFSEAHFKTLKYRPTFPARFGSIQDVRAHCHAFFMWYNTEHHHLSLGLLTPADVHHGLAE